MVEDGKLAEDEVVEQRAGSTVQDVREFLYSHGWSKAFVADATLAELGRSPLLGVKFSTDKTEYLKKPLNNFFNEFRFSYRLEASDTEVAVQVDEDTEMVDGIEIKAVFTERFDI